MLPLHSEVGGSGMGRWHKDRCPGSVAAAREYPNLTGYAAEEGTCAHELAETCLKTGLNAIDYTGFVFNDITVDDEMIMHVQGYLDFVRAILSEYPNAKLYVEYKFHVPEIHEQCLGTIDIMIVNHVEQWVWNIDFKYGRAPVSVFDNLQLKYYSVPAVVETLIGGGFTEIGHTIYQPRLYRDVNYETTWVKASDIVGWINTDLIPSMRLALSDNAPRRPGDHCRYCPAKLDCPELRQQMQYMAPPFPQTNEQLAWVLDMEKVFENTVKDAKERAADNLMLGQTIPGYKPVRSYGKSAIVDPSRCAGELLAAGMTHEEVYENKLRGITALKKNKLAEHVVQKYTQRGDRGITAAPMSSTKPAVAIPTQCFTQG